MRRFLPLWGLLLLALTACLNDRSPQDAAEGYLKALAVLDFDEASRYVADDGKANFRYLKDVYRDLSPEEQKKFQVTDWKVTGQTVTGDTATVDFVFDGSKRGQLTLQRSHGTWKVDHRQTF